MRARSCSARRAASARSARASASFMRTSMASKDQCRLLFSPTPLPQQSGLPILAAATATSVVVRIYSGPCLVDTEGGVMRVLLSDGSGLTARQCATQLAAAGHEVGVLSADPFALTRFTGHVHRFHRVPPFGHQPLTWIAAVLAILDREQAVGRPVDVLLPTQEQVMALALGAEDVRSRGVALAVPTTAALGRVFDKVSAAATLEEIGVPQPVTVVARDRRQLLAQTRFPVFVKAPVGTATAGVRLVRAAAELIELANGLDDQV